jgi:hypothetical protein
VDLLVHPLGGLFDQIGRHNFLGNVVKARTSARGDAEMLRDLRLLVGEGAEDPIGLGRDGASGWS